MKLIELSLQDFSKQVDSAKSTPGGGSVAAYVNNLGVALLRMLGHLTIRQQRFQDLASQSKSAYLETFNELEYIYQQLLSMVDKDKASFEQVLAAYKLDQENPKRDDMIQQATYQAALTPLKVAELAYKALQLSLTLVKDANDDAISDLIGGMYLLEAGINCALLNVKINAKVLTDTVVKDALCTQAQQLQKDARQIIDEKTRRIEDERL